LVDFDSNFSFWKTDERTEITQFWEKVIDERFSRLDGEFGGYDNWQKT